MNYLRDLFNSIIGPSFISNQNEVKVVVENSKETEVVENSKETEVVSNVIQKNVDSIELCRKQIKISEDLRISIHDMNNKIENLTTMTSSKNSSTLLDIKSLSNDFNKNTKRYNKKNSSSITKK